MNSSCSPTHTKLKFIDLTKEIEDCSKDQNLSTYHYQSTGGATVGGGVGGNTATTGGVCGQTMVHPATQRKKINKRFRNNPGFASNFFFFPSSVAVNGNTAANMNIQKEGSCSSMVSTPSTDSRRWSLQQSKQDKVLTPATTCEGAPAAQDDKGNELLFSEETCHSFSTKKSPPVNSGRGKTRNAKARLQRRFSCSDYLPAKSSMMTEQDLASIDNIYSPLSAYTMGGPSTQFVNFTFSSPDAPSQTSPPTMKSSARLPIGGTATTGTTDDRHPPEFEEEWDFLDPNAKKRRPSFDMSQDEIEKLFNAFTFEPIQEFDSTPQSSSSGAFDSDSTIEELTHLSPVADVKPPFADDHAMRDQAVVVQDLNDGYVNMMQVGIPPACVLNVNNNQTLSQSSLNGETELLFNSLPEEMKQQLVSFFLLQGGNGQPIEHAVEQSAVQLDQHLAAGSSSSTTIQSSFETKEEEQRSTSTSINTNTNISTNQEIDNMLETVSDQPLFEPITEIGLSELKEFGLFDDLEETLKPSNSNDDFEIFLKNL